MLDEVPRVSSQGEIAAYNVICEGLTIVAEHAPAPSVQVGLHIRGDVLSVEVIDGGLGEMTPPTALWLRGLSDRLEAMAGRLHVWSSDGRNHHPGREPVQLAHDGSARPGRLG